MNDRKTEEFFENLILLLKPGEMLAIPTKLPWPIFKWKWTDCIPDWYWKWTMHDDTSVDWEFHGFKPYWEWTLTMSDWTEYKGEWKDWKLEIENPKISFDLIIGDQDFFIGQRNKDGSIYKYKWPIS